MKNLILDYEYTTESVIVDSVYKQYSSDDILLVEINTITKYPVVDGYCDKGVHLIAHERSVHKGPGEGSSYLKIKDVPEGFSIYGVLTNRYSVLLTFVRDGAISAYMDEE